MKKIRLLFMLLCCFMMLNIPSIKAEETNKGSITVKLSDTVEDRDKSNVRFSISKVADVVDGEFVTISELKDIVDFNNINTAEELENISNSLVDKVVAERTFVTDQQGIFVAEDLNIGVYLLRCEDNANYDNVMNTLVSIPTFNNISKQMEYDILVDPKHEPLADIEVNKVDSLTKKNIVSKDFEFNIYTDKECKMLLKSATVDTKKGTAMFDDLRYGTYYIKEMKAPKGYQLSDQIVKINISKDGVFANDERLENNKNVYSFTYQNALLPTNVNTGVYINATGYLIVAIVVGGVVLYLSKKLKILND